MKKYSRGNIGSRTGRRLGISGVFIIALSFAPLTQANIILLHHTFDDTGGVLAGDPLDTNNVGASTWNSNAAITDDGNISVATGEASAYIDLGTGTISMGSAKDIYSLQLTVKKGTSGNGLISGGFWRDNPGVNDSHDNLGSPWWFWRSSGEFRVSSGRGFSADIYDSQVDGNIATTGYETFTFELNLTDATLLNNTVMLSDSNGFLGSATFSGDEGFQYVGIGGRSIVSSGNIQSMTLSQIPEPSSLVMLGLLFAALLKIRRRTA